MSAKRSGIRKVIRRHTVQYRLMEWGEWTQEPRRNFGRSSSPFGKIAEMQDNAGIRADGIRYEIIVVDDQAVSCPPDGGLSAEVERAGRDMAFDIKCREVELAVADLPESMRKAVIATYVVRRREDPRSISQVAALLNRDPSTIREALHVAHQRVARRIYGAFQIVAPEGEEADADAPEIRECAAPRPIAA